MEHKFQCKWVEWDLWLTDRLVSCVSSENQIYEMKHTKKNAIFILIIFNLISDVLQCKSCKFFLFQCFPVIEIWLSFHFLSLQWKIKKSKKESKVGNYLYFLKYKQNILFPRPVAK